MGLVNETDFKMRRDRLQGRKAFWWIAAASLFVLGFLILIVSYKAFGFVLDLCWNCNYASPDELAKWGDFLGGTTGLLWAAAATIILVVTYLSQQEEILLQMEELQETQEIAREQASGISAQVKHAQEAALDQIIAASQPVVASHVQRFEEKVSLPTEIKAGSFQAKMSLPLHCYHLVEQRNFILEPEELSYLQTVYSKHTHIWIPLLESLERLFARLGYSESADPEQRDSFRAKNVISSIGIMERQFVTLMSQDSGPFPTYPAVKAAMEEFFWTEGSPVVRIDHRGGRKSGKQIQDRTDSPPQAPPPPLEHPPE